MATNAMTESQKHAIACLSIQEADDGWVWWLIAEQCGIKLATVRSLYTRGIVETVIRTSKTRDRGLQSYWRVKPEYRATVLANDSELTRRSKKEE